VGTLALTALGLWLFAIGPTTAHATPPNVLVIVSDDQPGGTTDITDPNNGGAWMPNVQTWLKNGGTKFQWGFVTTPLCCPSRTSIFTGRYAHNHMVETDGSGPAVMGTTEASPAQQTTLQYYLHNATYRTGLFGKYLNDWDVRLKPPYFDSYAIYNNGQHYTTSSAVCPSMSYTSGGIRCVNECNPGPCATPALTAVTHEYETSYVARQANAFISAGAGSGRPWFAYLAPTVPHAPFTADPDSPYAASTFKTPAFNPNSPPAGSFESDLSAKPPYVQNARDTTASGFNYTDCRERDATVVDNGQPGYKECIASHAGTMFRMLKSMDDMVGSVMSNLQATGQLANTLVFYISDNGYMWGQHWLDAKPFPYSESVRVPMFMRGPGVPVGPDGSRMVANIDIAPTALAAAGVSPSPATPMDGRSLLTPFTRDRILVERPARNTGPPLWASIRTRPGGGYIAGVPAPYQYIETYDLGEPMPAGSTQFLVPGTTQPTSQEFYNLATDPLELNDAYPGAHYDPSEEPYPYPGPLQAQLIADLKCRGTAGDAMHPPCP
jgi:arylsulfatase A-like enzyme